jgi:FtsH-binding integral membrane protein
MSSTTYHDPALAGRTVFGQVMGYVAATVGFAALGADLSGATGLVLFVAALGAYGYATRRDLSPWGRTLFFLLVLDLFGGRRD